MSEGRRSNSPKSDRASASGHGHSPSRTPARISISSMIHPADRGTLTSYSSTSNDTPRPSAQENGEQNSTQEPSSNSSDAPQPAKKRKRVVASLVPRKRALTACRVCRIRKVKCDNVKPACGFCVFNKAECVYADENPDGQVLYDPASQQILQRLDEISSWLKNGDQKFEQITSLLRSAESNGARKASTSYDHNSSHHAPVSPIRSSTLSATPVQDDENACMKLEYSESPLASTTCESLLRWPIFNNVISADDSEIHSFFLESHSGVDSGVVSEQSRAADTPLSFEQNTPFCDHRGIEESDLVPLCKRFISNVHSRNPVLDTELLLSYAKDAAERGLQWDAKSCLVLIVCALGCYSSLWEPCSSPPDLDDPDAMQIIPTSENSALAETYFLAAKKRIGLLQDSIVDIQCLFFAHTYEKHALRPLRAWFHIEQACARLQAYLVRRRNRNARKNAADTVARVRHFEQRLYWSCMKAERELMLEIHLPASGIQDFKYPEQFPQPPLHLFDKRDDYGYPSPDIIAAEPEKERSWFYYFADISLRRAMNSTLPLFYQNGVEYWLRNIEVILNHYQECADQNSSWHTHLPPSIKFKYNQPAQNELAFHLQTRFQDWQECISRPFLCYALHHRQSDPYMARVLPIANTCVEICAATIPLYAQHNRHGSTWFITRNCFRSAMQILASVLWVSDADPHASCGMLKYPAGWQALVKLAIKVLARWGVNASDVEMMRCILEHAYGETCHRYRIRP